VETLIEQRRAALEGEQERQRCHEALRVKFAEKARELAEFVQARSERLRNLSGSPEEQQSSIAEIHAEVKGSAERYTELTHIQQASLSFCVERYILRERERERKREEGTNRHMYRERTSPTQHFLQNSKKKKIILTPAAGAGCAGHRG
jgi:DNA-binding ferritin-like protein